MPRTSPADLLLRPTRRRIIVALLGQQLTVLQLAGLLPDVPQATLYRQIHKLLQGGVITVAETRPVRGTLEAARRALAGTGLASTIRRSAARSAS